MKPNKIVSILLSIIISLSMLDAITANASTITYTTTLNGATLKYTVSTIEKTTAIYYCSPTITGDVSIPSTLGGYPVTSIGNEAFYECYNITSLVIPDTVSAIGDYAFSLCYNLASIIIPNSVTNIGYGAFSGCRNLTSINIPNSVIVIGDYAFNECYTLSSITIPNSVANIGYYAFYMCTSMTDIYITDIQAWCNIEFANRYSNPLSYAQNLRLNDEIVSDLVIPSNVEYIGNYAFCGYERLKSVNISDGITSIGNYAFYVCNALTRVIIPNSVIDIGNCAFRNCSNLININVAENNSNYSSINGHLFNKKKTILIQCAEGSIENSYIIPDGVTTIESYAFYSFEKLTNITIPYSVTNIGKYAFSGCSALISIIIPNGVTSIGDYTFNACTNLTSITIPDSVTSIGKYAFYKCSSLMDVYYCNTEEEWNNISIDNSNGKLISATIHFLYGHEHTFSDWQIRTSVTCTTNGEEYRNCSVCSEEETRSVSYTGHKYNSVITSPTCTEQGYTTYTCETCEDSYINDYTDTTGHTYNSAITQPTCAEQGYTTYTCENCEDSYINDYTDATGHIYNSVITSPTCTEQGYTTYACENCENSYIDNYTEALGHDFDTEFTIDKAVTETENGSKSRHCKRCDEVTDITVIPRKITLYRYREKEEETTSYIPLEEPWTLVSETYYQEFDKSLLAFSDELPDLEKRYSLEKGYIIYSAFDSYTPERGTLYVVKIYRIYYKYKYVKWSDWSIWSETQYTASDDVEVEKIQTYDETLDSENLITLRKSLLCDESDMLFDYNADEALDIRDLIRLKKYLASI